MKKDEWLVLYSLTRDQQRKLIESKVERAKQYIASDRKLRKPIIEERDQESVSLEGNVDLALHLKHGVKWRTEGMKVRWHK